MEIYTQLRKLQRKSRNGEGRKKEKRRKERTRLPVHNPFVGYFHHSRFDDPINLFLDACAPATPVPALPRNGEKGESSSETSGDVE